MAGREINRSYHGKGHSDRNGAGGGVAGGAGGRGGGVGGGDGGGGGDLSMYPSGLPLTKVRSVGGGGVGGGDGSGGSPGSDLFPATIQTSENGDAADRPSSRGESCYYCSIPCCRI